MTKLLLSVHVLAAIVAIGPITVAASMFPRFVKAQTGDHDSSGEERTPATAALLHRICRGYTAVGVAVPVFGLATGGQMGVLGDAWLIVSIVLTAIAAALLLSVILPGQERLLDQVAAAAVNGGTGASSPATTEPATAEAIRSAAARLAMVTGVFNLLWAVVVVLMIVRPGSTTGA
ncbi:membrane protein [Streptomyces thermospinosisporus]|uniref:Membrane protein n=1 Tax=Streptomyces thermospinosisporus TaxID=161482 RepID=A0ABP4JGK3_9ACTN